VAYYIESYVGGGPSQRSFEFGTDLTRDQIISGVQMSPSNVIGTVRSLTKHRSLPDLVSFDTFFSAISPKAWGVLSVLIAHNMSAIDINILAKDGSMLGVGYKLLNITTIRNSLVATADTMEITIFGRQGFDRQRLTSQSARLLGAHIWREQCLHYDFFISDQVMEIVKAQRLSGFRSALPVVEV
jgi:hypothetical protein